MLNTSPRIPPEFEYKDNQHTDTYSESYTQHGPSEQSQRFPQCLPAEGIARITCFLDPHSLLALGRVNKLLHAHVADEVTWQRAFLLRFLGVGPESSITDEAALMLRRAHTTWRKEYVYRFNLARRWELSRNSTIQHTPLHSIVSSMHMLPSHTLLSSSLSHGVVARSVPLTGKIIRGYLDAAGTGGGIGIGNPNVEFSPNVTTCSITSDGGTAKICWGFRSGEICVLTANRAMDTSQRSVASVTRSKIDQDHAGNVQDVVWADTKGTIVVSGSQDGFVKIWNAKKVRCLWTSTWRPGVVIPDPCMKLAASMEKGIVIAAMKSGNIGVFLNFDPVQIDEGTIGTGSVQSLWVPPLIAGANATDSGPNVQALHIDRYQTVPSFLVSYEGHSHFYRVVIQSGKAITTTFGDNANGATISSLVPYFAKSPGELSFAIVGDTLGCISIYSWSSPTSPAPVQPIRRIEAHEDASAVTALAWNGAVLITGSARGAIHVFDGLTLEHLRPLQFILSRPRRHAEHRGTTGISQILLGPDKDVAFASVDDKVVAFKAGPVPTYRGGGVRGRQNGPLRKKDKSRVGNHFKYRERLELNETISDEKGLIDEEQAFTRHVLGREKEQRDTMEALGLSESEALEYALMLSQDEASERLPSAHTPHHSTRLEEEGLFGDFDDLPVHTPRPAAQDFSYTPPELRSWAPSSPPRASSSTRPIPSRPVPSSSSHQAEFPSSASSYRSSLSTTPNSGSEVDFPSMSSAPSRSPSVIGASSSAVGTNSGIARSFSSASSSSVGGGGSSSGKSAWSTPLKKSPSPSGSAMSEANNAQSEDLMDEELKLAIELSLREAEEDARRRAGGSWN